jgi:WD40 repeat protein
MESELQLSLQILINCSDASVLVRREAMIALSKFIVLPTHIGCITLIAKGLMQQLNSKQNGSSKYDTDFEKGRGDSQTSDDKSENKSKIDKASTGNSSPWILSAAQSETIIDSVQQYLHQFLEGGRLNKVNLATSTSSLSLLNDDTSNITNDSPPPIFSEKIDDKSMAAGYVRLWLAIKEVQSKDPHPLVVAVADAINKRINDQIAYNDKKKQENSSDSKYKVDIRLSDEKFFDLGIVPPLSPLGVVITDSINRGNSLKRGSSPGSGKTFNQRKVRNLPRSSPFASNTPRLDDFGGNRGESIDETEQTDMYMDFDSNIPSILYDWIKKLFLKPDSGYDSYEDQLSDEGNNKIIRESRVKEIINFDIKLKDVFKDVDDKNDLGLDIKAKEEMQMMKANIAASLPTSVTKFEQKAILNIENAEITSMVMFHAFENILAVSDSRKIGIWSLNNGSCIMELNNNPTTDRFHSASTSANARITSMSWINESYDSLLMVGSDDGTIKIWKDTADPEYIAEANSSGVSSKVTPTLASAFMALPDVADTSVGSGMVFSWLQHTGNLVVGGNSSSIRVWDMEREQCVRAFSTGLDTCTTALASHSVNNIDFSNSSPVGGISSNPVSPGSCRQPGALTPVTWSFAGFADGSIGIFDERVNTLGGRVHLTRDHSAWIVSAHLRPDIPEVITASVRGSVKFWDLRSMRTFKTFEVFKSPLTALSVHNSAPIMATGSHAQFIKILTLNGDQLGNIIKYHDGFLGQRIGAVSCLAFHPWKLLLAAGATDSIVSIYSCPE